MPRDDATDTGLMPAADFPLLTADADGIWRQDKTGRRSGIRWGEIYHIGGYKLDLMSRVVTVVELDWDFGEFIEFMDNWPGFDDVVNAITSRVPGIVPDWIVRIRSLSTGDNPVDVWKRE